MAIEAIRNLINQSDKSLFDVKTKLKEEAKKNIDKEKLFVKPRGYKNTSK